MEPLNSLNSEYWLFVLDEKGVQSWQSRGQKRILSLALGTLFTFLLM